MAVIPRPSPELSNKTNPNPVVDRFQEATAEDFSEISQLFDFVMDYIEGQSGTTPSRYSVGTYTSLTQLNAAIPTGQPTEYAIVEEFPGATIKIAVWNETSSQWQYQNQSEQFVFITDYDARPNPGEENTFYITLDRYNMYLYKNSEYHLLNPPSGVLTLADTTGHLWSVIKDPQNQNPDINAIQVNDICEGFTDSTYTRYLKMAPTAIPFNVNDPSTFKRIEEKLYE